MGSRRYILCLTCARWSIISIKMERKRNKLWSSENISCAYKGSVHGVLLWNRWKTNWFKNIKGFFTDWV